MYQPPHFREDRVEVKHALIRAHPLGLLISAGPDGILANPVPFLIDPLPAPFGTLRAHLARANPQWRALDGADVLVVFQGVDTYVTPSWYQTKADTGKVVPTWNYAIVQARGRAVVKDDRGWLAQQAGTLTDSQEQARPAPWKMEDAPPDFIDAQMKGIVGIEITVMQLDGKWKVSQNRTEPDRAGVVGGILAEAGDEAAAQAMALLVQHHGR